jgi:hypothetical protein
MDALLWRALRAASRLLRQIRRYRQLRPQRSLYRAESSIPQNKAVTCWPRASWPAPMPAIEDGVTSHQQSATVNGAPCMPVVGNSNGRLSRQASRCFRTSASCPGSASLIARPADDKWSVRGGYGLYNINMLGSSFYSLTGTVQAYTQHLLKTRYNSTTSHKPIGYAVAADRSRLGRQRLHQLPTAPTTSAPPTATNWKDPYTEQWSLGVEHDLRLRATLRASPTSARRRINWSGRRMKTRCLTLARSTSAFIAPISSRHVPQLGPH